MIYCLSCGGSRSSVSDWPSEEGEEFFCSGTCERAYQAIEAKREKRDQVADG